MSEILSRVDGKPIAFVYENALVRSERQGPDEPGHVLQTSAKRLPVGKEFRPHSHIQTTERHTHGTQEAWVVVSGLIEVTLYDLDDSVLDTILLDRGDCVVLYRGGHSMKVLVQTLLYEFKNGPYLGTEADKRWL